MNYLVEKNNTVILNVYVQPKASRTHLRGHHGDALKLSVTSPPIDNKANDAVIQFIAKVFRIPKSAVSIQSGHQSRSKRLVLEGISAETVNKVIDKELAS